MKRLLVLSLLAFTSCLPSYAQAAKGNRVMSEAEYKTFLRKVQAKLPVWEQALRNIDPAKDNLSYAVGQRVVKQRDLGLEEIRWARNSLQQELGSQRTSHEISLQGSLQAVFNITQTIMLEVPNSRLALERYAAELGELLVRIGNDVIARVELLEQGTCHWNPGAQH